MSIANMLEAMSTTVKARFEGIYNQHYNPNIKGGGYEKIVRCFLESYLSGRFTLHERGYLLDTALKIDQVFSDAENEWDVVGTYQNATPSVVLEREGAPVIPFDAVGFLVAVKQTLTQTNLEKDLDRFVRLETVEYEPVLPSVKKSASVDRPFRVLFYYEGSFSTNCLVTLATFHSAWDVAISFRGGAFIANSELALTKHLTGGSDKPVFRPQTEHVLPWMLLYITYCLPQPLRRDMSNLLFNLLKLDLEGSDAGS